MEKSIINFLVMDVILLFVGISFVLIVFDLSGVVFMLEFLVLVVLMFFLIFAMLAVHRNKKWGWMFAAATLAILLLDTLFTSFITKKFGISHAISVLFSIIGIVIALLNLKGGEEEVVVKEDAKVSEYYQFIDKMEPKEEKAQE